MPARNGPLRLDDSAIGLSVSGCLEYASSGGWLVASDPPCSLPVFLSDRRPRERSVRDRVEGWVFAIDRAAGCLFVTDDEFGRLPISDGMRARYRLAIGSAASMLQTGVVADREAVSELKGMFNRCVRRDQRDWLAVYELLGRPELARIRQIVRTLTDFRRASVSGRADAASECLGRLRGLGLADLLQTAGEHIEATTPHLAGGRRRPSRLHQDPAQVELVRSVEIDFTKTREASATHQRTLDALRELLRSQGYTVEENTQTDAWARLRSSPGIFEVKSISPDNEVSQIRAALSQLYEYRYRFEPSASLWVVLSARLSEANAWMIDYLQVDRSVGVLWLDAGVFRGDWLPRLNETLYASKSRSPGDSDR
jgi:hypothetical protein